jgi:hypothetical protein
MNLGNVFQAQMITHLFNAMKPVCNSAVTNSLFYVYILTYYLLSFFFFFFFFL